MRDRALIVAWVVVLLGLAAAVFYAELTYDGGRSAGVAAPGEKATGATVETDPAATGAEEGAALTGAAPAGEGPPGRAVSRVELSEASPPAPEPMPVPVPATGPAAQPPLTPGAAAPPARIAYAAPPPPDNGRPRIVVIISEIGVSNARSRQAIERLPPGVTIAVMTYADDRGEWIAAARAIGHEVLLAAPMEPENYPRIDPGPEPLLIDRDDQENLARYDKALTDAQGVVGVLAHMGGRFLRERDRLRPILAATQDRGLLFVDNRATSASAVGALAADLELHVLLNDRFIDAEPSRDQIDRRLAELEDIAARRGHAVGIATPYPVAIERIRAWAEDLEARGFVLAPATAVAGLPTAP